jgi:hypothetical protein
MDDLPLQTFKQGAGNAEVQGLLNGALDLTIKAWDPTSKGGMRSSSFWAKTRGGGEGSSFLAGAAVMDGRLYDSITLVAHAAHDCVYDSSLQCRVDNASHMMDKIRAVRNVDGVSGSLQIQSGVNNIQASRFELISLHNGYNISLTTMTAKTVGHISSETSTDLVDVCAKGSDGNPRLGPRCGCTAWPTPKITARQSSNASLRVAWTTTQGMGTNLTDKSCLSLLRGYSVEAYLGERSFKAWGAPLWIPVEDGGSSDVSAEVHALLSGGDDSRGTDFQVLDAPWIQYNKRYHFSVRVAYAEPAPLEGVAAAGSGTNAMGVNMDAMIFSTVIFTDDVVEQPGVPSWACVPPVNQSTTNVCGILSDQYHSQGQPGEHPADWGAKSCPVGAVCMGRVFQSMTTREGYVVQGIHLDPSSLNQTLKKPEIQYCLLGKLACPGGAVIYNHMLGLARRIVEGPGVPHFLSTTASLANIRRNSSGSGGGGGIKQVDGSYHPASMDDWWYQCAEGYAGKRCDTCNDGFAFAGMSGTHCAKCQIPLARMWAIMVGGTLAAIVLAFIVWLALKRRHRVFEARDALLIKCREIERHDGYGGVVILFNNAFNEALVGSAEKQTMRRRGSVGVDENGLATNIPQRASFQIRGQPIDKQSIMKHPTTAEGRQRRLSAAGLSGSFTAAVSTFVGQHSPRKSVAHDAVNVTKQILHKALLTMNVKHTKAELDQIFQVLDTNQDGHVSIDEFIGFVYGRKVGEEERMCTRLSAVLWNLLSSDDAKAIASVMVGYFQLVASVEHSFPIVEQAALMEREAALQRSATASTRNTTDTDTAIAGLTEFSVALGTIDIFGTARCLTGARYENQLLLYTVIPLCLMALAAIVSQVVTTSARLRCPCKITPRFVRKVRFKKNNAIVLVSFFTYPIAMRIVLRSFLCDKLTNRTGHDEYWMTQDSTVRCSQDDATFVFVTWWAVAMTVCLGLTVPAFQLVTLWPWRYPMNRLYIWDKHGRPVPNADATKFVGGSLFAMHRAKFWYFEPLESVRTTVLMSAVGVIYANNQDQGLLVTASIYVLLSFLFFYVKPYAMRRASILQSAVHMSVGFVYVFSLLNVLQSRVAVAASVSCAKRVQASNPCITDVAVRTQAQQDDLRSMQLTIMCLPLILAVWFLVAPHVDSEHEGHSLSVIPRIQHCWFRACRKTPEDDDELRQDVKRRRPNKAKRAWHGDTHTVKVANKADALHSHEEAGNTFTEKTEALVTSITNARHREAQLSEDSARFLHSSLDMSASLMRMVTRVLKKSHDLSDEITNGSLMQPDLEVRGTALFRAISACDDSLARSPVGLLAWEDMLELEQRAIELGRVVASIAARAAERTGGVAPRKGDEVNVVGGRVVAGYDVQHGELILSFSNRAEMEQLPIAQYLFRHQAPGQRPNGGELSACYRYIFAILGHEDMGVLELYSKSLTTTVARAREDPSAETNRVQSINRGTAKTREGVNPMHEKRNSMEKTANNLDSQMTGGGNGQERRAGAGEADGGTVNEGVESKEASKAVVDPASRPWMMEKSDELEVYV